MLESEIYKVLIYLDLMYGIGRETESSNLYDNVALAELVYATETNPNN